MLEAEMIFDLRRRVEHFGKWSPKTSSSHGIDVRERPTLLGVTI